MGCRGPASRTRQCSASQDEHSEDMDFSAPPKSRLSAPQIQLQLSRLTDRTRLRRLKSTLLSKGAWQQARMSPTSGSTTWTRVRNVQKRLGNRAWPGFGERVPLVWLLPGPTIGTLRSLQHGRSHPRTLRMRSRCGVRLETRRPGHYYGTQRAHSFAIHAG